jgi:chromate transporter
LLYGVKPVVIAVILQALWGLGRAAVKSKLLAVVGVVCAVLSFFGVNALLLLASAGAAMALARSLAGKPGAGVAAKLSALAMFWRGVRLKAASALLLPSAVTGFAAGMWPIFLVFLKIGSVVFGSGYVLLAFLRADLVLHRAWVTDAQLMDAVAIGQVTPGPVFTTATFLGYLLRGPLGAVVATVGIFLPAFVFVALSGPLVPRIRKSPTAGAFLDGVNAASLALMAVVSYQLARASLVDAITVSLALASAILLLRFRTNSAWLVLGGAVVGVAAKYFQGI